MKANQIFLCASSLAIATSVFVPAQAQEVAVKKDVNALEEIIVTAQRREENLQRAAISVSAVTAEALAQKGVTDITQLSSMVPALQVASSYGGGSQFTLRGVGNLVLNLNSDTAVITNLDGVPIARATSIQGLFYDLERVEVLKGPQGTLYGRNATGGAINVLTAKPKFDETSGYINGSYGNYNAVNLTAAVNLPVAENAALRIAGTLNQHDGYFSDGSDDQRLRALRATFRAKLSDNISLTIGGDYASETAVGYGGTFSGLSKDERIGIGDPRAGALLSTILAPPAFTFLSPLGGVTTPYQHNEMWGIHGNLDVETSIGTLSITPAYRRTHLDVVSLASGFINANKERDEQKTLEVRLVSPTSNRLQYIVGAFYMAENNHADVGPNQQVLASYGFFEPTSKAYAGYARLTYKVTPEFRISLAGRYTSDKRSTRQAATTGVTLCPAALANPVPANFCLGTPAIRYSGVNAPAEWYDAAGNLLPAIGYPSGAATLLTYTSFSGEKTFHKLNWRAGLEYDVGPRSLAYATVETGFKAGGFYNSVKPNPTFSPETVTSYTLGLKNRFLDNRLQVNIEAFWLEYKDKQFSLLAAEPGGNSTFATINAGNSRSRGAELDALAQVTPTTRLNLDVQYLDAKETDFKYSAFGAPPATGCSPVTPNGAFFDVNCSGQTSVNSPKWTINAGVSQTILLPNDAQIRIDAQTRYQSAVQTSYDFVSVGRQKGYTMSDLYVTYEDPNKKYYITGFVSNIEDTAASTYTQVVPAAGQFSRISLTPPRTYGVRLGVKF